MAFRSLVSVVSEQCQEIKRALELFPYFESWDDGVIAECCRLGSITEFPPDKIILGSGKGNLHMVFFVLDGTCQMIRHINAVVKVNSWGKTIYKLYQPSDAKSSESDSNGVGYKSALFNQKNDFQKETPVAESPNVENACEVVPDKPASDVLTQDSELKESEAEEIEDTCKENSNLNINSNNKDKDDTDPDKSAFVDQIPQESASADVVQEESATTDLIHEKSASIDEVHEESAAVDEVNEESAASDEVKEEGAASDEVKEEGAAAEEVHEESVTEDKIHKESASVDQTLKKSVSIDQANEKIAEKLTESEPEEVEYDSDHHLKVLAECKAKSQQISRKIVAGATGEKPKNVKTFFVQIGFLKSGACFALDKSPEDFSIMSVTKVKCLMIPRRFLIQHNPSNIWNRIQLFFDLYLPKGEEILQAFVNERKWVEMKRKKTLRIVSSKKIPNYNTICEVPFSIRLKENTIL